MSDSIEPDTIIAAVCVGLLLGGLYFGGLWWTVRRMPHARHPLNLYFGSVIVRLTMVLAAFYGVLANADWPRLVASLAGFVAARMLLIRLVAPVSSGCPIRREAV
jgi:F1F0 ATPase subunit 2